MKELIRKILKEQEEIINVPDLDFFDGDWEQLLEFTRGRKFRVRENLNLRKICPETLGNMISVDGYLNLKFCENLTSLGSLERVDGHLDLNYCESLTSLGNLKYIGGHLDLFACKNLTSLGNLEYIGGDLFINVTKITKKYSESEIRRMVEVKGDIYK